jgi:hypothetical protein
LRQRLQRVETALAAAQSEMREGAAAREKTERALESESRRAATQVNEIGRLRGELAARDQSLAKVELAFKEGSDQGALAAQDNVSLREAGKAQAERLEAALRRPTNRAPTPICAPSISTTSSARAPRFRRSPTAFTRCAAGAR